MTFVMDENTPPSTPLEMSPQVNLKGDFAPHYASLENDIRSHLERQQYLIRADAKNTCIDVVSYGTALGKEEDPLDWVWKSVVENQGDVSQLLADRLSDKKEGIPTTFRGVVWQTLARSSDTHLEVLYDRLVQGDMGMSSYERLIDRDVKMSGESDALGRLLKAYSVYDAHVGYSQSLLLLAKPLLMVMEENQAFCTFVRLMEVHEMRSLNLEGLHLRLHQYLRLLEQLCPALKSHLARHGMHPPMYVSQWFLTLFGSSLPTNLVLHMYDFVFAQGAMLAVMRLAIATMQKHQDELLAIHDFAELRRYLTSTMFFTGHADFIDAFQQSSLAVTRHKLDVITKSYRPQPQIHPRRQSWTGEDSVLHRQIEDLVTALSHLQKEHSQLNDDITALKLKEIDSETERSRLSKRNQQLEKRVKKYKMQLTNQKEEGEGEYKTFVDSLRTSGDFGSLVATALSQQQQNAKGESAAEATPKKKRESTQMGNEIIALKFSQLEKAQQYEALEKKYQETMATLTATQNRYLELAGCVERLKAQVDQMQVDKELFMQEHTELIRENEELVEKNMAAKRTAAEIEFEKIELTKKMGQLHARVDALEEEKKAYLSSHQSFADEVFTAHKLLFDNQQPTVVASTAASTASQLRDTHGDPNTASGSQAQSEYEHKYVEGELRCRELEKLLAEAKVKLAEYEAGAMPLQRRMERRDSAESYASSITSATSLGSFSNPAISKRTSMYARLWSSAVPTQPANKRHSIAVVSPNNHKQPI